MHRHGFFCQQHLSAWNYNRNSNQLKLTLSLFFQKTSHATQLVYLVDVNSSMYSPPSISVLRVSQNTSSSHNVLERGSIDSLKAVGKWLVRPAFITLTNSRCPAKQT